MSIFHNSLPAERLAYCWHVLGVLASFNIFAMALCSFLVISAGMEHSMGLLAMLRSLKLVLVVDMVVGGAGVGWHIWACSQHREVICGMEAKGNVSLLQRKR